MQPQCKSHAPSHARQISRGRPAFADSQREQILELLRATGPRGVSRAELIFTHHMTQCATRVFELRELGFVIHSEDREGRYPTWYILQSEPLELKGSAQKPSGGDWYRDTTGRERPGSEQLPPFELTP